MNIRKDTSWEKVASWYDELLSNPGTYQTQVILPNLLRLIPPQNKRILDIACGQGFFSYAFADQGAEVLGADLSPSLVRRAQAGKRARTRFTVAEASHIPQAESNSFDGALIVLALQNIKDMQGAFKEAARALKEGGVLAIVLNHPCFRIPQGTSWGYDEDAHVQYRRIDRYGTPFSARIDMKPGKLDKKVETLSFHRPLQEYAKALAKAGFCIASMEEWNSHKRSEKGPRAKAEDHARKEFPLFLTIVAKKHTS